MAPAPARSCSPSGRAYGYGRSGVGNPTAAGIREAANAIALRPSRPRQRNWLRATVFALIAMAGEKTATFREQVVDRLAALGVRRVVLEHDLLGIFHSGTAARTATP